MSESRWCRRPLLSPRERAVLLLREQGLGEKEIAPKLEITARTVRYHVHSVLIKTGAKTVMEAIYKFRSFQV